MRKHPQFDSWPERSRRLASLLEERIVLLDGAMGTFLQRHQLAEKDYRGVRFAGHPRDLKNLHEALNLVRPDLVQEAHRAYLEAGAEIIETNTFNANAVSLEEYGLRAHVGELNAAAVRLAKAAAAEALAREPGRERFVAGVLGPTNRTLSLAVRVQDPAYRANTFDEFAAAYSEQARALLEAGADLLLVETVFDTLVAKAALYAIAAEFERSGRAVPVMVSVTITDQSGRTLSGQTVEAFWTSVAHFPMLSVGINCALGPREMRPYVEELARLAPVYVSCHPNAGLPNPLLPTGFPETPETLAQQLREFAAQGWLNIVGGCCGTTPAHIQALAEALRGLPPRRPPAPDGLTRFSGLEALVLRPASNLIFVGERTNVAGSPRFAKLVRAGLLEEGLAIARQQLENGAHILDINFDEALLDSEDLMSTFLRLIGADPDIARAPLMLDSSKWSVLEAGLKATQGKAIVNSISLKEGEEQFVARARQVRRFGAAAIVMAFDERGQADAFARKAAICGRAYRLLTEQAGFPPEDVIFDPNILTVGTGIEAHNEYAVAFLDAARWIKQNLPGARVSGGVSNLSFAFRGNPAVREAMHAVFLYHAIRAGLDVAIVNAGQLAVYTELPAGLRERVEDLVLNRRPDATERLLEIAATPQRKEPSSRPAEAWRQDPVEARLKHAVIKGVLDHLDEDVNEALAKLGRPLAVIEGPLMAGMNVVGELFGAGKMFLPQVVKSARAMKKAVAVLLPRLEAERAQGGAGSGSVMVIATVKGDVHDIGKNIVGAVLGCNNCQVVDLGVMVPAEKILAAAREKHADLIGLSGLITPSLDEMVHVAKELQREGFRVPLLIGGATTSRAHTAIKIAPAYAAPVIHVLDASRAVGVVGQLVNPARKDAFVAATAAEQEKLREEYYAGRGARPLVSLAEARRKGRACDWNAYPLVRPEFLGARATNEVPLERLVPFIDWSPFFSAWGLAGKYPQILDHPERGEAARELFADTQSMLGKLVREKALVARGAYGFFPANRAGDDIHVWTDESRARVRMTLHTLRQQEEKSAARAGEPCQALADFVAPADGERCDYVGAFVVTAGHGLKELVERFKGAQDEHGAIMVEALADRLAEAFAEFLHKRAREEWGFGRDEKLSYEDLIRERYRGIRPAPGYPACPEHTEKRLIFDLLKAEKHTGVTLTESYAMWPAASVCGLYFSHPAAKYFAVGRLGRDQVEDYAARKSWTQADAEKWLAPYLGYIPLKRG